MHAATNSTHILCGVQHTCFNRAAGATDCMPAQLTHPTAVANVINMHWLSTSAVQHARLSTPMVLSSGGGTERGSSWAGRRCTGGSLGWQRCPNEALPGWRCGWAHSSDIHVCQGSTGEAQAPPNLATRHKKA